MELRGCGVLGRGVAPAVELRQRLRQEPADLAGKVLVAVDEVAQSLGQAILHLHENGTKRLVAAVLAAKARDAKAREVSIVDLLGKQVFHETSTGSPIVWNCRNAAGTIVPSGVYVANIVTRASKRLYQSFSVAK